MNSVLVSGDDGVHGRVKESAETLEAELVSVEPEARGQVRGEALRRDRPDHRIHLLIVEGHEDTRALYALALSGMGFNMVAELEGTEAFRRAWEMHPDIVVTDLALPHYDGWQLLQDVKSDTRTRNIPVVAVSGYVQRSVRDRAERDGFAAFFPKPCRQMHSRKDFGTCSADRSMHTLGGNGAVHLTPGHWLRAESELREATDAIDEEAV